MPLTDAAIRAAKRADKPRLPDGGGLYLEVSPAGGKLWRLKYRFGGIEKRLALGAYPDIGLKDARGRRDEARKLLANGIDPGEVKKAQKAAACERAANSFEVIAREWFAKKLTEWAKSTSNKNIRLLERDVFPWLGGRPIAEITAPEVLALLRRLEARGKIESAHRVGWIVSQIIRYAIATGRAERDPVPDLRGALETVKVRHFAAFTDPIKVGELLRALDAFTGTFPVQCALRLAPLLFVRPGELRQAQWADIDLEKGEWKFSASKTNTDHLVPLASQAVAVLRELHPFSGHGRYVFPGGHNPQQAMSEAAVNAALKRMGYDTKTEITGHGFRAMARTLLAEELHQKPEVIEHQLAHAVSDSLGTAYNRTKFLKERKTMMQLWANYLDKLKAGAKVIPLKVSQQ